MVQLIKMVQAIILAVILLISTSNAGRIHRLQRSTEEATTKKPELCPDNTPCGWAVYTPFTRKVEYFMKNTCECESELLCRKTDDDLSASAFVYRCRPKSND